MALLVIQSAVDEARDAEQLRARVAELEAENAKLRAQVDAELESRLKSLDVDLSALVQDPAAKKAATRRAKPGTRAETLDEALARYGLRLADFQEHYQEKPGVIWTVIHAADRGEPNAADGLRTMAMPLQPMPGEVGEAARDGEL